MPRLPRKMRIASTSETNRQYTLAACMIFSEMAQPFHGIYGYNRTCAKILNLEPSNAGRSRTVLVC